MIKPDELKKPTADELRISLKTSPEYKSTDHKKDEEDIGHLAAIVESSEDAIISKSLDGIIKSWNKGAGKMFGYTAKQAIGEHISLIIPPEYINEEKYILERIRNNNIIEHYETVRIKKDGERFYVSLTVSPLKNRAGKIIGVSKIARDITSRKKSEAELNHTNKELAFQNKEKEKRAGELTIANNELVFQDEEKEKRAAELIIANKELVFQNKEKEKRAAELIIANKELVFQNKEKEKQAVKLFLSNKELKKADETVHKLNEKLERKVLQLESVNKDLESFSYSVSHDLRTPLRAVHGYTKMLKEDYITQLDPEANRLMDNVMNYAKKMGQLIDDLLSFSRIGRKELMKENIPMNDIVSNLCSEIKSENNLRNIQFEIDELLPAQGDSVVIKQAWINLISNAVKYSKLNTKTIIKIGSEVKGDEIIYHVKDNGVGFDMRYADKLFGVFQRLHSDKDFDGTGVGLAIVHRIICKHGGNVWAEGKVNEGATFYFSLPKI